MDGLLGLAPENLHQDLSLATKIRRSFALQQALYPYPAHLRLWILMKIEMRHIQGHIQVSINKTNLLSTRPTLNHANTTPIYKAKLLVEVVSIEDR